MYFNVRRSIDMTGSTDNRQRYSCAADGYTQCAAGGSNLDQKFQD